MEEERHLVLLHQHQRSDVAIRSSSAEAAYTNAEKSPKHVARTGSWTACFLILGTELCDSVAYGGIARNVVSYLTGVLQESNAAAAGHLSMWTGTCFLTTLVGAFLADSYWGRYTTMVVFLSVYPMAMVTLTLSASLPRLLSLGVRRALAYLGLYLVALSSGCIKSCACPLGADQFDEADPVQRAAKASFFNWSFFCANIGFMLASTVLVWVQERVGWSFGFGISALLLAAALTTFVGCRSLYTIENHRHQKTSGSPLTGVCQVVVAAFRKRGAEVPSDSSLLHEEEPLLADDNSYKIEHTNEFRFLDRAAVVVPGDRHQLPAGGASPWALSTVTRVEEVKMLLRLLTMLPTNIFFFAVSAQMSSTFVEQGAVMDGRIGPLTVPPATLSSLEVTSILLCIPAYEAVLVPLARRVTGRDQGITQLQRVGVGFALATLTMAYMALVETKRLAAAPQGSISIVWQAPAYFTLGAAEVFASVGLLEFYYDQSPETMKSLCTAGSLVAVAAGNYLN